MGTRRMLSRRQCVFVIVVLPALVFAAMYVLKVSDTPAKEILFLPKVGYLSTRASLEPELRNASRLQGHVQPRVEKCSEYIWTGRCTNTCYRYNTLAKQRQRKQQVFKCDKTKTQLRTLYTNKQKFVHKVQFGDTCLKKVVDWYCHDGRKVPNIVHYIWFGKIDFTFINFLSFLSAHKFQNPCLILVHADRSPKGTMWNYFLQISSKVIQVQRKQPKKVFGNKVSYVEHKADVAKLEALKEYGGIYMDTDQVLVRSLDSFRNNDVTVGLDYSSSVANSLIISKKNAPFIKMWYDSYRSLSKTETNRHSNVIPYRLAQQNKDLVTIAENLFTTVNAHQLTKLYSKNIDWTKQYGIHMQMKLRDRFYTTPFDMDTIKGSNTTAGAVARFIIFGNTDLCLAKTVIQ